MYFYHMEVSVPCQKLYQAGTRRLVIMVGIIVGVVLMIQFCTLPYGNGFSSLFPSVTFPPLAKRSIRTDESSDQLTKVGELHLSSDLVNSNDSSVLPVPVNKTYPSDMEEAIDHDNKIEENDRDLEVDFDLESERDPSDDLTLDERQDPDGRFSDDKVEDQGAHLKSEKETDLDTGSPHEKANLHEKPFLKDNNSGPGDNYSPRNVRKSVTSEAAVDRSQEKDAEISQIALSPIVSDVNWTTLGTRGSNSSNPLVSVGPDRPLLAKERTENIFKAKNMEPLQSGPGILNESSTTSSISLIKKKKKKIVPPTSIPEMTSSLLRNRVSFRSMKPRWSSIRDQEILSAKRQIENAPVMRNDPELYAPLFRNVSMFKRSYELMERMLKVYIYKEGGKPIFHTPILKGIYASEGWFMRLMEGNKHFRVKDPQKAHLFYMPFSSRFLQYALYVPGSHNQRNLAEHLKIYVDKIASKYPFWNRTGGTDHFLVACHDWAPYETRGHMERSIRALCNADLSEGFLLGKDVSLPETFVHSPQKPLRDLGGNPASKRPILAFFAGNMHGSVRPILLQHWENKDPVMKILGPMPRGSKRKSTYIQYMRTSKYCICPRGYEVNSPRVVEAIFYECVPVIISDNFVPPFFDILDWEAFAVFVAEKDIPMLKDILLSIPEKKYLMLQLRVKKLQQHFLWHSKPVKYDIFHMILHSIWFNRLHTIKIT